MPNYRRALVPGGRWFFTVNLQDRKSRLLIQNIELLRAAYRETQRRFPFQTDAIVVLPNHIHAIWSLPEGDTDFSVRWRRIRALFSKGIPAGESLSSVRAARGERGIWQRRFWEHVIRDENDFRRHVDYCYFNPVKHGFVENVGDWPYSSYHRDVKSGTYEPDQRSNFEHEKFEYGD